MCRQCYIKVTVVLLIFTNLHKVYRVKSENHIDIGAKFITNTVHTGNDRARGFNQIVRMVALKHA